MRLEESNPLFRRVITPWYDSNTACWMMIIPIALVVLFSLFGIAVARENPEYHAYFWMPVLLLLSSLFVCVSVLWRLMRRYYGRYGIEKDKES